MYKYIFFLLLILPLRATPLFAQSETLHVLLLIDEYSDIAPACEADKIKMEEEVKVIAQKTRLALNLHRVDYSKGGIEEAIAGLAVSPNDVILFYFTGHGYRYERQEHCGKYPYLYLTKTEEHLYDAGLCLENINEQLKAKKPRLLISLADCCNNVLPYEEPIAMNPVLIGQAYKKLFLGSEGYIIATSSLPGQYSFATSNGGYFTNGFLESLREISARSDAPEEITWERVLKRTAAITILNSDSKQKPQYDYAVDHKVEIAVPSSVILPAKGH
ncbi:MAG TPA: caspase family protein [Saprospiraceae bacterium]|nr:caspase family protein [Saprospiraceae bacterium]